MLATVRVRTAWCDQGGSIYLAALMATLVMTLLGLALFDLVSLDSRLAAGTRNDARALYAAETGLSQAFLAYANGRPWPTGSDTPFTDQTLSYDTMTSRFTVTASPTPGVPDQLRLVSTGCSPKPLAGGACPGPSGWAKVQTTVQRESTTGPPTSTTTTTTTSGPTTVTYSLGSGSWCQYRSRTATTCP